MGEHSGYIGVGTWRVVGHSGGGVGGHLAGGRAQCAVASPIDRGPSTVAEPHIASGVWSLAHSDRLNTSSLYHCGAIRKRERNGRENESAGVGY